MRAMSALWTGMNWYDNPGPIHNDRPLARSCIDPRQCSAAHCVENFGMNARWEHFSHGADIGVRGFGETKAEAFEQAALALTAVLTDPEQVEPREAVAIACEAPDDELLFADWLNCLVYE